MRSYYWWNNFKKREIQRSHRNWEERPNAPAPRESIYGMENGNYRQWYTDNAVPVETASPTLGRFLRLYRSPLIVCLFWATVCVLVWRFYGGDFLCLGIPMILYFGLLGAGLVVCVGLPIKWFREYRSVNGQVINERT